MDCPISTRLEQRQKPTSRPVMHNHWSQLLFLHWKFDPAAIQALLPPGLIVDCFEGSAWVGVVPFGMEKIRPVYCPPVPGISWFLEMNLRTYVIDEFTGIPGVWFFSLDASQWLACAVARKFFHLPYFHATMSRTCHADGWIDYSSKYQAEPEIHFRYRAAEPTTRRAEPGTLEFFLLERYVLFSWNALRRKLSLGRVRHTPYEFCEAETTCHGGAPLFTRSGLIAPQTEPDSSLFSPGVTTLIYPLQRL